MQTHPKITRTAARPRRTGRLRAAVVTAALLAGGLTLGAGPAAAFNGTQDRVGTGTVAANQRGTTIGIAYIDRVTGEYRDNGPAAHTGTGSASIVKLFIADDILYRNALNPNDQGQFDLMLRSSDDNAANHFWTIGGGPDIVRRVAARYGLREVAPPINPGFWGLTTITASNIAAYYNGMLGGCCGLPGWAQNTIVNDLRQSTTYGTDGYYQRFGIPTGLPDERTLGVKQGWMDVNGQRYNHTTGIIGNDNRYILVELGQENRTNGDSNHTTQSLSTSVSAMYPERIIPRVQGAIADDWYALGGMNSPVGLPLGNENPIFDHSGVFTLFQRGSIYWSPASGAHEILGAIRDSWANKGYEQSFLHYPTTDESGTPDGVGRYNHFQSDGSIYWTPATGAQSVHGAIQDHWSSLGWERSVVGYPTTDESGTPDGVGRYNHFTGGDGASIYYSPATGAFSVHGAIRDKWAAQGWERSALGYPTSDENAASSGRMSNFGNGAIYWSPTTGTHSINAPILASYRGRGAEAGSLGFPISDPYAVPGGTRVDFQGGSLTVNTTTGVVTGGPTATPAALTPAPTATPTPARPTAPAPVATTPTPTPARTTAPAAPTATRSPTPP